MIGTLLLARALGAEDLRHARPRVGARGPYLLHPAVEALDEHRPRDVRVRSSERLAVPVLLGVDVGVIPPAAGPRRVADRHQPVHAVLVDGAARQLDVVGPEPASWVDQ